MAWEKDEQREVFHLTGDDTFIRCNDHWIRNIRRRAVIDCLSLSKKTNLSKHEKYKKHVCELVEKIKTSTKPTRKSWASRGQW